MTTQMHPQGMPEPYERVVERLLVLVAHQRSPAYGRDPNATCRVTDLRHASCIASTRSGAAPREARNGRIVAVIG